MIRVMAGWMGVLLLAGALYGAGGTELRLESGITSKVGRCIGWRIWAVYDGVGWERCSRVAGGGMSVGRLPLRFLRRALIQFPIVRRTDFRPRCWSCMTSYRRRPSHASVAA